MRKFLVLFLAIAALTACSEDDNQDNTDDGTRIVGKWFVAELDNPLTNDELSECNKQSFIEFFADNNAHTEFYAQSNDECQLEDSDDGEWAFLGGNQYRFNIPGLGAQSGNVDFESDSRFIFTNPSLPGFRVVFEKR